MKIPVNFDAAVEPKPVSNGLYQLQITGAKVKESGPNSKNPGTPNLWVTLAFVGDTEEELNAPAFNHICSLPSDNDEPRTVNFKVLMLKRFLTQFGVPFTSGDLDLEELCMELPGHEARAEVRLSDPNPDTGSVFNTLVVPRLQD